MRPKRCAGSDFGVAEAPEEAQTLRWQRLAAFERRGTFENASSVAFGRLGTARGGRKRCQRSVWRPAAKDLEA